MHTCIHTCMHTYMHTYMHTMRTRVTNARERMQAHPNVRTYARERTLTHATARCRMRHHTATEPSLQRSKAFPSEDGDLLACENGDCTSRLGARSCPEMLICNVCTCLEYRWERREPTQSTDRQRKQQRAPIDHSSVSQGN